MKKKVILGLISLVLGIVALLLSCIVVGVLPAIISIVFAVLALKKGEVKGFPIVGIVCSAICLLMATVVMVYVISGMDTDKKLEKAIQEGNQIEFENLINKWSVSDKDRVNYYYDWYCSQQQYDEAAQKIKEYLTDEYGNELYKVNNGDLTRINLIYDKLSDSQKAEIDTFKAVIEQAQKAEEERIRKESEEQARKESEEQARKESEEQAKKESEEQAKKESEEQAKKESEEQAKKESGEQAKKESLEQARKAAEESAKKKLEDIARQEPTKDEQKAAHTEKKLYSKDYADYEEGFSFGYPDDWVIRDNFWYIGPQWTEDGLVSSVAKATLFAPIKSGYQASVHVAEEPVTVILISSSEQIEDAYSLSNDTVEMIDLENVTLDGYIARKLKYSYTESGKDYIQIRYIYNIGISLYTVTCTSLEEHFAEYEPIFDSIMNTYRIFSEYQPSFNIAQYSGYYQDAYYSMMLSTYTSPQDNAWGEAAIYNKWDLATPYEYGPIYKSDIGNGIFELHGKEDTTYYLIFHNENDKYWIDVYYYSSFNAMYEHRLEHNGSYHKKS